MRIHLPASLRDQLRTHLVPILLAAGAILLIAGLTTEDTLGLGKFAPGTHIDVSGWLMFSGLVVIVSGALVAVRRFQPE